ncbi:MAG TPA: PVC-type heme-binding CxxCH protein, partial [Pirellulales bacterium]
MLVTWLCLSANLVWADPPNTQQETIPLLTPEQALAAVDVPKGFRVSLFASDPEVRQPIAMAFDTRDRLWVAECYSYVKSNAFDTEQRDRVLIFEDTDHDGKADRRTVFWDRAQRLTSVEVGFGGVWVLCPPQLLFIPDADRDDRPDGEPIVVLDGWATTGHTFANGLRWGPDGWLYGRQGIQGVSHVGAPGTPDEERTPVNCGIWRFHPQRKAFEMVCHGTTNPWGMDWDDHGELFFINTVIGHLWHAVPGAHFRRMYGEDLRPQLYELIEQTADHVHWDAGEDWTATRKQLSDATSRTGGGHAHTGLMIYLGENWPQEYRGELFTLNLHGRRINHDHLERAGATYVGRHRPDLMSFGDPWFRPIDLAYGGGGGVYVLDWSD